MLRNFYIKYMVVMFLVSNHAAGMVAPKYNYELVAYAQLKQAKEVLELIDLGADVNSYDALGRTVLMFACQNDDINLIRTLIKKGADVTKQDVYGNTAINYTKSKAAKDLILSKIFSENIKVQNALKELALKSKKNKIGIQKSKKASSLKKADSKKKRVRFAFQCGIAGCNLKFSNPEELIKHEDSH